jgi:hypothetical protein
MRFFELINLQDILFYLFPSVIFVLLFAAALSFAHFRSKDSEESGSRITHIYSEGIGTRTAPFPLFLILIIIGTVIWAVCYTLTISLSGVRI